MYFPSLIAVCLLQGLSIHLKRPMVFGQFAAVLGPLLQCWYAANCKSSVLSSELPALQWRRKCSSLPIWLGQLLHFHLHMSMGGLLSLPNDTGSVWHPVLSMVIGSFWNQMPSILILSHLFIKISKYYLCDICRYIQGSILNQK